MKMKRIGVKWKIALLLLVIVAGVIVQGVTVRRSFRNGYPVEANVTESRTVGGTTLKTQKSVGRRTTTAKPAAKAAVKADAKSAVKTVTNTVVKTANAVKATRTCDFSKFRDHTWVTGVGKVVKTLPDDLDPPCHQRFLLKDESGRTLLIVNNIDDWERLDDVRVGETIAFKGEFIDNERGGLVHWTHPDPKRRKPGGWLMKVK